MVRGGKAGGERARAHVLERGAAEVEVHLRDGEVPHEPRAEGEARVQRHELRRVQLQAAVVRRPRGRCACVCARREAVETGSARACTRVGTGTRV